jgi:hypothetical protein
MLLGLAAAATTATAAKGAGASAAPKECPGLLALADRLDGVSAAHTEAVQRVGVIVAAWGPQWPVPDMRIVRHDNGCKPHRDIQGWGIRTEWGGGGRMASVKEHHNLGTPEYFEASSSKYYREYERQNKLASKRGAKSSKAWADKDAALIAPARAYWSEVERVTAASGIEAAQQAETEARDALRQLVGEIVTYDERTITGLVIKAQAMTAWGEVGAAHRAFHVDAMKWSDAMTKTIIKQTAG